MNPLALTLMVICAIGILVLPRRWAPLALLLGSCYMRSDQSMYIGDLRFPIIRVLILVGFLRTFIRREKVVGDFTPIDKAVLLLAPWMVFAAIFHNQESGAGVAYSGGLALNIVGLYFLIRIFCANLDDVYGIITALGILLVPIAIVMITEKIRHNNYFFAFASGEIYSIIREGKLRAQGPFRHPILAGTVGAVSIPFFVGIFKRRPVIAVVSIIACLTMVITCSSSGPLLTLAAVLFGMFLWPFRHRGRLIIKLSAALFVLLSIAMGQPAYYIMARIDLAGGSTGWHRSELINQAILRIGEWWMYGTDYTRHWMPTGITFSKDHTDITNYFIAFGVSSGLVAVILVMYAVIRALQFAARASLADDVFEREELWLIWMIGAACLGHMATSLSVSYFDQSFLFFWFTVAVANSCYSEMLRLREVSEKTD